MRTTIVSLMLAAAGCHAAMRSQRAAEPLTAGSIRTASDHDLEAMLELAAAKRVQYQKYSPLFWRPAADAKERQRAYFRTLLHDASWICLVHEGDANVDGFVLAHVVTAPPVYDPGGKVCMIDDFAVAPPALWPTVGNALRDAAELRARQAGAVLSVTVCGAEDRAKRAALDSGESKLASEWYVRPLASR